MTTPKTNHHPTASRPDFYGLGLGLLILVAGTIFLRLDQGHWERTLVNLVYDGNQPPGSRFFLATAEPWNWFKHNDFTLTLIFILSMLGLAFAGCWRRGLKKWRYYAAYGLTSLLIGPGLLVNALFKGFWGRPRPSQTMLWPDSWQPDLFPFYRVWDPAFLHHLTGASFPCGHASIVIIYIVFFYIFKNPAQLAATLPRPRPIYTSVFRIFKYSGWLIAWLGGGLMGFARIAQGAHFPSDVLWSFGMVLLVNWWLYYYVFKVPQHD